jgi:ketosteroid isomerase-like protein
MEQLKALNAQFIKNWVTSDTVKHNEIIHKDFVYISSSGKVVDRKQYMKNWAKGYNPKVDKSFEYKNEHIRIFGNMALVRSNTYFSRTDKGKTLHGQTVYTDTYIKENGRWYCVQAQITDLQ